MAGDQLTRRQTEILGLLAEGLTRKQIGRRLYIGENTVRTHLKGIFQGLGAHTSAHAVSLGYAGGILSVPAQRDASPGS